jgi:hypothetical protein
MEESGMSSVQDAIYNWLTIKVVCDERPTDKAANETEQMFFTILKEDYGVSNITIDKDDVMYFISYVKGGEPSKTRFPRELIEVMINQINETPEKYINYPI